ncbi:MAG: hypothetical protein AAGG48_06155 [Planctomycetota bacterium]
MKRIMFTTGVCLAFAWVVGCGSERPSVVETRISDEDQRAAEQSISQYDTPEYAESMSSQNRP